MAERMTEKNENNNQWGALESGTMVRAILLENEKINHENEMQEKVFLFFISKT